MERIRKPFIQTTWAISSEGVGPIRFGMAPRQVEAAVGQSLARADRDDDDCEFWSPQGRKALRIAFWDGRALVFDVREDGIRTSEGIGVGMPFAELDRKLAAARLPRAAGAGSHEFPLEARLPSVAGEERSIAFEVSGDKVSEIVFGDSMLVHHCTFLRRLNATKLVTSIEVARDAGKPMGYSREGFSLPDFARGALSARFHAWRLALPSQGDVDRCFSDHPQKHPSWFEGDFDADGRQDVAAQITSFGRGGIYLVLASGPVVEVDVFVGSGGGIITLLRKGETVGPIDEPAFRLKADALMIINCEKSAVVYWLEEGQTRKVWVSD